MNNDSPLQRIYAHEQAFQQSARWLDDHYPGVTTIAVSSNGAAAKLAKEEATAAAIAGDLAVEHYGLTAIARNIEDNPQNETRFIILGKQKVDPSGADKTSLLITTPNVPGSLLEVLKPFSEQGINISQIASRPYRHRQWSYLFFLDIEGHQDDPAVKLALAALSKKPMMVNVLGSYPKAII
jgi:chorismate mutase/prephenate dehydratase